MGLPKEIVFDKYADSGFFWQGSILTDILPRLAQNLQKPSSIQLSCRLHQQDGIVWLQFDVIGGLILSCDRCLSELSYDITGSYALAILRGESQIAQVADQEYILVEELADGRTLPIWDLLEDELLLSLPLSVAHEDCTLLVSVVGEIIEEPKENPFAILQNLKSNAR